MGAPTANDSALFDGVARQATAHVEELRVLARYLQGLGSEVTSVVGGTATGQDKAMLGMLASGAQHANAAAQQLATAAQAARKAAQEARLREQQQARQRGR